MDAPISKTDTRTGDLSAGPAQVLGEPIELMGQTPGDIAAVAEVKPAVATLDDQTAFLPPRQLILAFLALSLGVALAYLDQTMYGLSLFLRLKLIPGFQLGCSSSKDCRRPQVGQAKRMDCHCILAYQHGIYSDLWSVERRLGSKGATTRLTWPLCGVIPCVCFGQDHDSSARKSLEYGDN